MPDLLHRPGVGPVLRRPCVGLRCRERFRRLVHAAHHAAQLPHPQVQLHVQQWSCWRIRLPVLALARHGDQRAEGPQAQLRLPDTGHREAAPQAFQHGSDGSRPRAVQHPQQVHEGGVLSQLFAKREAPLRRFEPTSRLFPEEQLVLRPDVLVGRWVPARIHPLREVRLRHEVCADDGIAKKLVDPLTHLADHGVRRERLVEDFRHVVQDCRPVFPAPDGGRRAGADQPVVRLEPCPQPPDEAGKVRPLRAVERVQLVHHQKAQDAAGVVPPEREIDRPREQQIEHLVVGEQDVRWMFAQDLTVLDEVVRSHASTGRRTGLTHVQPRCHPAPKRRSAVDDRGDAPRLIRRERVHGIDDDGLDAGRAGPRAAVVEYRIEEALGLAGTGSGRDDGGPATGQPIEGGALMAIRLEPERGIRKRLAAFRCALKRQVDGEVGPLEQVVRVVEEVLHHIGQCRIRRAESGGEEVPQGAGDFGGEGGGDHGW